MQIEFTVWGQAQPAGSKTAQVIRRKGGAIVMTADGRPLTATRDSCPKSRPWKNQVAAVAREHYSGPLLTGAVMLDVWFEFPRPKGHYGTGRNAEQLKQSAPTYHLQKPDALKLTRAVEDALTGVIWRDDCQIVDEVIHKGWGDAASCRVRIITLPAEEH